ncbi:MAG: hypothetical protein JNK05_12015 [Myxococcales bacterium]|nr:hypothetical protein [Myxococcales bacterium]
MNAPTKSPALPSCRTMQVPPIDSQSSVLVRFHIDFDAKELAPLAMAATGTNQFVQPHFEANAEYWYALSIALATYPKLYMTLDSQPYTADALSAIVAPYPHALMADEKALARQWIKGDVSVSLDSVCALFKAPDPDMPSASIGLLVEQSPDLGLRHVSWYKTWDPAGGNVWSVGAAPVGERWPWALVVDAQGNPSLSPRDIDPHATWYSFTE